MPLKQGLGHALFDQGLAVLRRQRAAAVRRFGPFDDDRRRIRQDHGQLFSQLCIAAGGQHRHAEMPGQPRIKPELADLDLVQPDARKSKTVAGMRKRAKSL